MELHSSPAGATPNLDLIRSAADTNYRTHWIGGLIGSNAVARIDFNIAQGWATYYLNGRVQETFSDLTFDSIDRFLLQTQGFTSAPGNILKVDEMLLSRSEVPAEVFERWTYDEVAGKGLHQCFNNGSTETTWQWESTDKAATDGNGSLLVNSGAGEELYKPSNDFSTPLSDAITYSLEIRLAEWDIDPTGDPARLNFRLGDSSQIEIQTQLHPTDGLSFTYICANANHSGYSVGGLTGSNAVARIDFNRGRN